MGRTHWAKGLWIVADVVVIGGILGSAWWHWQNAVPDIAIPAPAPLPSPNGYDLLRQASGMIHETETMDRALSRTRVQNGNVSYGTTPPDPARVAADIAANTPALRLARQSLQVAFRNPPSRSFTTKFPDLAHFRAVARVLSVEGSVHETNGEYGAAAQSRLDAMQLGADQIPNGGVLIHYLVGIACEAIGRRPLWSLAGKLSADEARAAALRLQRIDANRVSLADALAEEKWGTQASLQDMFRQHSMRGMLDVLNPPIVTPESEADARSGQARWAENVAWTLATMGTSKAEVLRNNAAFMDALVAQCRMPYRADAPELPAPKDPVNAMLAPVFSQTRLKEADSRTQSALLIATLGLRAYMARHGVCPESLDSLVAEGALMRVPIDPLDPSGAPVRYHRLSDREYLLYSVGPDGKDNGGVAIDNPFGEKDSRQKTFLDKPDLQGDYVVGVNLY